ncbi:helix-turn-helix domain-containing protein [Haladaptatus sp. DYF46]|uniref:helix-turn-helix domain-containing protein n=1 Tax=Haladaptatus sp. DYF46 TaxID=2886041 RepID=UPI001E4B0D97|nr:helix-turn-helix domain-containing protein [Haladaptatus sp. DYF46]
MAHGASNSSSRLNEADDSSKCATTKNESASSGPPRTLFAEIFVSHERLVLVPTIESISDVSLKMEEAPMTDDSLLFVSAVGDDFSSFERALETDATVREATLFSVAADRRVYRIRPKPDVVPFLPAATDLGVRTLDVKSGTNGWVTRIQMLSREPLIELRKSCLEHGTTFRVRQLYDGDPNTDATETRLTGRQRDTVLTAYRSGYYNVPRGISQGELAEKLDVSTSAISQQLRRATRQLIASTFAVEQD